MPPTPDAQDQQGQQPVEQPEDQPQDQGDEGPQDGGQPQEQQGGTVNRHKYDRDTQRLKSEVEELRRQAEETSKLRREFEEYRAKQEAEMTESALKAAGCIDVKAAGACLEDYKGDVAELKKAKPYLFASDDNSQSTGGAQKGNPDPEDARTKRLRASMGLKN